MQCLTGAGESESAEPATRRSRPRVRGRAGTRLPRTVPNKRRRPLTVTSVSSDNPTYYVAGATGKPEDATGTVA